MKNELRIVELNREYKRIESLLIPQGFTLVGQHIFYGEYPFNIYCGKMEDYQMFIDNADSIRVEYLESMMESLGID